MGHILGCHKDYDDFTQVTIDNRKRHSADINITEDWVIVNAEPKDEDDVS